MPNVKFNLDKPKSKEKTLVLLKFSYNHKRLRYSTRKKIMPVYWNQENQRAKQTSKFSEYPEFNAYLNKLESDANRIYDRFKLDEKVPSIKEFKEELDKIYSDSKTEQPKDLFGFIESFIKARINSPKITKATIKSYKAHFSLLKDYSKNIRKSIDFQDINYGFYEDFLVYLFDERDYSINYVGNIIKTIKTILNNATEQGINTNMFYKSKHFRKPSHEPDSIYLTVSELEKVFDLDLTGNSKLEQVRDLFIIGCFTGLRFSDFTTIKPVNFTTVLDENGKPYPVIKKNTQKTNTSVTIPIHPFVDKIIKKYNNNIPRSFSNQKMNEYIKDIAKLAMLDEKVQFSRTNGGKITYQTFEKWEKVTTHTARRSFATNAFKSGIPSISIMAITGHKTETAFMRYIKVTREEHAIIMAKNTFFKSSD